MVFLFGVKLKKNKNLGLALKDIYGLNDTSITKICNKLGLSLKKPLSYLTNKELKRLKRYIELNHVIGKSLQQALREDLNNLVEIQSYRGFRHKLNLPVRGQRTWSNGKTQRKLSKQRKFNRNPVIIKEIKQAN